MKSFSMMIAMLMSFQVSATYNFNISDMQAATRSATELNETLFGDQSVLAYQVDRQTEDLEVNILTRFQGDDLVVEYDCHYDGPSLFCHEHDDHASERAPKSLQLGQTTLADLIRGEAAALQLVNSKIMPYLVSYKIWAVSEADGETETWARMNFIVDGVDRSFFAVCHDSSHGSSAANYHCDIKRSAPLEPEI